MSQRSRKWILQRTAEWLGVALALGLCVAALYEPPPHPDPELLKNDQPVHERDPARAVLYQGRGIRLVKDGKLELALDQFHRAAAYDPLNISVPINIAYVLDKLGRYEEAIAELKTAEKIDPRNSMVYLNWGRYSRSPG